MLDVWLKTKQINVIEHPIVFMERQNWLKKSSSFVLRKIRGKNDK